MNRSSALLLASAALIALLSGAAGAETLAVINARLSGPDAGPSAPGTVILIEDGRIARMGEGLTPPAGATMIDARGRYVTAGFIAPSSSLGAVEVGGVRETHDDGSGGKVGAAYDIGLGVNPASTLIPLARRSGITRAVVTPVGGRMFGGDAEDDLAAETAGAGEGPGPAAGLFAGRAAAVTLNQAAADPVFRARAAMVVDLGDAGARSAGSHAAALQLLRTSLEEAKAYAARRTAFEKGQSRPFTLSREDLEALVPVAEGRMVLLARAHRASDIRQLLKLKADYGLKLVIEGAEEGWMVADDLARAKVGVLIDPEADLPEQFESLGARLDNAARLYKAGALLAIEGSRGFENLRQARFNAGTAVSYGLPYGAAIAALTENPAKMFGLDGEVGALRPGRQADLVIWSGDPLETSSAPDKVLISGVEQSLDSRSQKLIRRYAAPAADGLPSAYH